MVEIVPQAVPTISVLIPCFNEEASVEKCILSCLNQTVHPSEIIVVDDGSTDNTPNILKSFGDKITVLRTPRNLGNKSHAQQFGLGFVRSEIVVTTDGDTVLDDKFIEEMQKTFLDPKVVAVAGYVKSLKFNWLTCCRAVDYAVGQNIHKLAQYYLNFLFVIPGAAGAFRVDVFKKHLSFDHDTVTEDLDFTYKLHQKDMKVAYNRNAIVYTQDPSNLQSYINQMRRWFGGGWQNLAKHLSMVDKSSQALELSLMYIEGLFFSVLLLIIPILSIKIAAPLILLYVLMAVAYCIYAAYKEKRIELLLVPLPYVLLMFLNAYIFVEQFVERFLLRKEVSYWFKPERVAI